MPTQLDLFPETLPSHHVVDDLLDIYMVLFKTERRVATLKHIKALIDQRLEMEPT